MDFGIVGFDSSILLSSNSNNNNVSFALDSNNDETDKQKWFGSGHSKHERNSILNEEGEEDVNSREYKVAKTSSSYGEQMLKVPLVQRSNNIGNSNVSEGYNQQMLGFSSQNNVTLPHYYNPPHHQNMSCGFGKNTVLNIGNMQGIMSSVRGPFTPSQWIELEHQALIYKYITANVPIPPYLLNPIRKAFESACFSTYSGLRSNPLGWGTLHLGFSNNNDPEPGRCRRTDGKKWRCSRDAVGDQKYCERHMNRGRHRSRKPVEGQNGHSNGKTTQTNMFESESASALAKRGVLDLSHQHLSVLPNTTNRSLLDKDDLNSTYRQKEKSSYSVTKHTNNSYPESSHSEFGLVCSDSLLNPLNASSSLVAYNNTSDNLSDNKSQHFLRQFMDDWPKNHTADHSQLSDFMSSTSSPITNGKLATPTLSHELDMGLRVGGLICTNYEPDQKQMNSCHVQLSWETSMGGPLGEALHTNIGDCKNTKPGCSLNLMEENYHNSNNNNYMSSSSSSPTGVLLYRPELNSLSNSSAGSSPRGESGRTLEGSIFGRGIINPSLPAM